MTPFLRRNVVRVAVMAVVVQLYVRLVCPAMNDSLDLFLLRQWFAVRGPRPVPESVVVVRVDTRSYRRLGLTRNDSILPALAQAVESVRGAGAKLIVLDYFFDTGSSNLKGSAELRNALADSPSVIGWVEKQYIDTDLKGRQSASIERLRPDQLFAGSAKAVVRLLVRTNSDVVREISLSDDRSWHPTEKAPLFAPLKRFVSPDIKEPGEYDLINFYGEPYGIPDVPLYRLVAGAETVPQEYFKDKAVFIGAVDLPNGNEGKDDSLAISGSWNVMWGVEIHATIAANLLDGSWIRRMPAREEEVTTALVLNPLVFGVLCAGLYWGFIAVAGLTGLWFAASYYCFTYRLFYLPGVSVFAVIMPLVLLGMAVATAMRLRRDLTGVPATGTGERP